MLAAMNAAGGGDNRPKMFGGTTYAAGGGMVGEGEHKEKMSPKLTREDGTRETKQFKHQVELMQDMLS